MAQRYEKSFAHCTACDLFRGRSLAAFREFITAKRIQELITGMTTARSDFFPLRIFVVEDQKDTLEALQHYLEQLGHIVLFAQSKAQALKEIPRSNCQVLISDINLPDGNGWELMRELGNSRPSYAIALSGYWRHFKKYVSYRRPEEPGDRVG
jgi:PleD family two-component response regulator